MAADSLAKSQNSLTDSSGVPCTTPCPTLRMCRPHPAACKHSVTACAVVVQLCGVRCRCRRRQPYLSDDGLGAKESHGVDIALQRGI